MLNHLVIFVALFHMAISKPDFRAKLILCTLLAMMLVNKMATSATIGSASQAQQQIYRAMSQDLRHYLEHVFDTEHDFLAARKPHMEDSYEVSDFVLDRKYDDFDEKDNLAFNIKQLFAFYETLQQMATTEMNSPQGDNILRHFETIKHDIRGLIFYMQEREKQAGFDITSRPTASPQSQNSLPTTQPKINAWEYEVLRQLHFFLTMIVSPTLKLSV